MTDMTEETDTQTPNDGPSAATGGSGLERPYCPYCDGYHDDSLSCEEKLSTVSPKAERLTTDDLWTAIPQINRCKVSFAMLHATVKRLNAMGVRIVRECREEGAPEMEAIGGVHVDATRWMKHKIQQEDRDIQMSHAIKAANSESQNDQAQRPLPTVTLCGKETMEQPESNEAAERASGSMERMVRPMSRHAVTFKASLTACTFGMFDARDQIASELRRIADMLEEGCILSESGNMGICDYGSWEMPDPWDGPNEKALRPLGGRE